MVQLSGVYIDVGQWNEAVQLDQEILKLYQAALGPKHPVTLNAMGELANHYLFVARYDDAQRLNEETLKLKEAILRTRTTGLRSVRWSSSLNPPMSLGGPTRMCRSARKHYERCRAKLGPG